MNAYYSNPSYGWRAGVRHVAAALGTIAAVAVVVLFAWNSFAVTVLDAAALRFKEALGLTLLVVIAGRLLVARDHRHGPLDG